MKTRVFSRRSIFWIGMLCLLFIAFFQSQAYSKEKERPTLTLVALQDELLKVNPEIEAARLKGEIAQEEIPQSGALEDPEFIITQWDIPSTFQVGHAEETWYGIRQAFPFPGKRFLQRQVAESNANAAQQALDYTIRDLLNRAKTAYYQLFLADKNYRLHLEHQTLLEEYIQIATKKYTLGQISQQEIITAQLELTKLHLSLHTLEQERSEKRAVINTLLNRTLSHPIEALEDLVYRPFLLSVDHLTERAMRKRPELVAARFTTEKSKRYLELSKKNKRPDFMLETAYMDRHANSNAWMLSITMNLPWHFKKYDAQTRQAALQEAQAHAEQMTIANQTRLEVLNLFTKIKTEETQIHTYQKGLLPQAKQALEAAQIDYRVGKINLLNLIDRERALLDLRMAYFDLLTRFFETIAQLEVVIGEEIKL